jgi:hypothetical protein
MKMFCRSCYVATFPIVCVALLVLSACASNNGSGATPVGPPTEVSGLPAQPAAVLNLNQRLLGEWSATYPGGPFRVAIQDDPLIGGTNYVATLVDGGYGTFHAGSVVFRATPDQVVPNLAVGTQTCPDPGFISAIQVSMTITVIDAKNFTEDLVQKAACKGFPVRFTRIASSGSP